MSPDTLPLLRALSEFFAGRSVTAYLVGGSIRDALLGRRPVDVDLAVSGDAAALGRELAAATGGSFISLNEAHAAARVALPEEWGGQGGPTARVMVDLATFGQDIALNLARRDFTIDAMALSLDDALANRPRRG